MRPDYDVIVAGGGTAGVVAAIHAARAAPSCPAHDALAQYPLLHDQLRPRTRWRPAAHAYAAPQRTCTRQCALFALLYHQCHLITRACLAGDSHDAAVVRAMCARMWHTMERIDDRSLLESQYTTLRTAPVGPCAHLTQLTQPEVS